MHRMPGPVPAARGGGRSRGRYSGLPRARRGRSLPGPAERWGPREDGRGEKLLRGGHGTALLLLPAHRVAPPGRGEPSPPWSLHPFPLRGPLPRSSSRRARREGPLPAAEGGRASPQPRLSALGRPPSPSPGRASQRPAPLRSGRALPFVFGTNFLPRRGGDGRGSSRSPPPPRGGGLASPPLPVAQVAGVLSRGAAAQQQPQPQEQRQEPGGRGAPHGPPPAATPRPDANAVQAARSDARSARGLAYMVGSAAGRSGYPMPGSALRRSGSASEVCTSSLRAPS